MSEGWQERWDSNPQPLVLETSTLPIELLSYITCRFFAFFQGAWWFCDNSGNIFASATSPDWEWTFYASNNCGCRIPYIPMVPHSSSFSPYFPFLILFLPRNSQTGLGADIGNRTRDLILTMDALCLLSYVGILNRS